MSFWTSDIVDDGAITSALVVSLSGTTRALLRSVLSDMDNEVSWSQVDWNILEPLIAQATLEIETEYEASTLSEKWVGHIREVSFQNAGATVANGWVTRQVNYSYGEVNSDFEDKSFTLPRSALYRVSGWTTAYDCGFAVSRLSQGTQNIAVSGKAIIPNSSDVQLQLPYAGLMYAYAEQPIYLQLYATLAQANGCGRVGGWESPAYGTQFSHLDFFEIL